MRQQAEAIGAHFLLYPETSLQLSVEPTAKKELATLGPVWRDRLNEHGLLRDFSSALEFLALTEARPGHHGPFFLFSLYAEPEA